MSRMPRLAALAAVALIAAPADAQFGHHRPPQDQPPQQVDCDHLPPGIGMDRATCEQMNQMASTYSAAQTEGAHPGDDQMTCDQIKAELMQQPWRKPDPRHVAEAQAASSDQMAAQLRMEAKVNAMAAASASENMGASAAAMANPVAGAAAERAAAAHQAAEQAELNAEAKSEIQPKAQRTMAAMGNLAGDVNSQLQSNPRAGRLMYLAQQRNCRNY